MTNLTLEKRLYYERNPDSYFRDHLGSRDRWRNYLDRHLKGKKHGTKDLTIHSEQSQTLYVRFVKKDSKNAVRLSHYNPLRITRTNRIY